jgi:hypothetical protein
MDAIISLGILPRDVHHAGLPAAMQTASETDGPGLTVCASRRMHAAQARQSNSPAVRVAFSVMVHRKEDNLARGRADSS